MHAAALVLVAAFSGVTANGYGTPDKKPAGVGAYAYQDSLGNRYGGTYLDEADIPNFAPDFSGFSRGFPGEFPFGQAEGADFFAQFMKSLQKSLEHYMRQLYSVSRAVVSFGSGGINQNAFPGNSANQQAALRSVDTAFDATLGRGGASNYDNFGQQHAAAGMEGLGNYQHPPGANSAYAGGAVGPQGTRQIASISPPNANQPNVDVSSRSGGGDGGYRSVSSSSFATSSDVGGRRFESRGAETVVDDNGKVTKYNVRS